MNKATDFYDKCIETFHGVTKGPSKFLQADEDFCSKIKNNLKEIYDFTKNEEIKVPRSGALPKLVTENFDLEQIWQQIELQNDSLITPALPIVSKLVVNKAGLLLGDQQTPSTSKETQDEIEESEDENEDTQDESVERQDEKSAEESGNEDTDEEENLDELKSSDDEGTAEEKKPSKSKKASAVDDAFFKLSEMEQFLVAEEKKLDNPDSGNDSEESDEGEEEEEDIDLFEQDPNEGEDDMELAKYKDFFVAQDKERKIPQNKHLRELEEADDQGGSSYQLKQSRLNQIMEEIEEEALEEKPWQLKGEITATSRPQNSLLEEIVEFDLTSRPAPVMTEQTTMQLEDIIKQRIKDKVFDSVERKVKPTETPLEYKKKIVLDQEKSKESLAQIYEKEFLQQQADLSKDEEVDKKEPELHQEINSLMRSLFVKLDALSNFHFTPKPAIPELKIISNLPAINMEEVAPVAASDATLLAPEEVKSSTKGDIIGKAERTATDKKRERRKKKIKQKIHAKEKQKKEQTIVNKKYSKEKAKKLLQKVTKEDNVNQMDVSNDAKAVKSSKAFFTQLEEQVKSQIKRKSDGKPHKKKGNTLSAKKLKL